MGFDNGYLTVYVKGTNLYVGAYPPIRVIEVPMRYEICKLVKAAMIVMGLYILGLIIKHRVQGIVMAQLAFMNST